MSWRDSLTEAEARLAALEAAELALLTGGQVAKISGGGESVDFAQLKDPVTEIARRISDCRIVIARLKGGCRGGVITPIMGG